VGVGAEACQPVAAAPSISTGAGIAGIPVWCIARGGPGAERGVNMAGRGGSTAGDHIVPSARGPSAPPPDAPAAIPGAQPGATGGSDVGEAVGRSGSSAWIPRPETPCRACDHSGSPVGSCEPNTDTGPPPHAPRPVPQSGCDQAMACHPPEHPTHVPQNHPRAMTRSQRTARYAPAHPAARPK